MSNKPRSYRSKRASQRLRKKMQGKHSLMMGQHARSIRIPGKR